jgi:hypothetical protein
MGQFGGVRLLRRRMGMGMVGMDWVRMDGRGLSVWMS